MEQKTEVLVVGGGPVGVCCAHALAAAGARVLLLEKEEAICPPTSAAHGNCGLVTPSHVVPLAAPGALRRGLGWMLDSRSPFYVSPRPSLALARWLWLFRAACSQERARAGAAVLRELHVASAALHAELADRPGAGWRYHRHGIVQVYETRAGLAEARAEVAMTRRLGVRVTALSGNTARQRFPGLEGAVAGGLFFEEGGHVDPMLFTRAVAKLAADLGASVRTGTEVIALERAAGGALRVATTRGDIVAEQVVVAAGAWTPALARGLGLSVPIQPAKGYSVDVPRPQSFPEVPLYLGEAHTVLTPLAGTLRLGGTLELSGWDMTVRRERVAQLRRAGRRACGMCVDSRVRRVWRGPRPLTPDGLPLVGRVPRCQNVILAAGHCMLGLSLGPVTGRLVAELAGGGAPSLDLAPLAPGRFS